MASKPNATTKALIEQEVAKLREGYAAKLPDRMEEVDAALAALGSTSADESREGRLALTALVHKLAGTAPTFGFGDVGEAAARLEAFCHTLPEEDCPPGTKAQAEARSLIADLRAAALGKIRRNLQPNSQPSQVRRRFLVVDDEAFYREYLRVILENLYEQAEIVEASDLDGAESILRQGDIDVCLLDLFLGDEMGTDLLLRFSEETLDTAIIIVTGHSRRELAAEGLARGAGDYLVKGQFDAFQLEKSIEYALYRKHKEVELSHKALHDPLTGLPNRLLMQDRLGSAARRARRQGKSIVLLYIDIDGFKAINDTYGHDAGDLLLIAIAERLGKGLRETDTVARLGGDEFAVVMEGAGDTARKLAQVLWASLCTPYDICGKAGISVGASIGMAALPEETEDTELLIQLADQRMYQAKRDGGGVVAGYV